MPRPIFFDLYFTLLEPDPASPWLRETIRLLGVEPKLVQAASLESYHDRMIGAITTPDEVVDRSLAHLGITVEPAVRDQLIAHRWEFFHTARLFGDVLPALSRLRERGHRLALVTNCSAETSVTIERLELGRFFEAMALSCDLRSAKPDPEIYQYALDALGVDPAEVVYVGDGDTEEHAGAASFGMTTVLLQRPGAKVRDVKTDYVIASLDELFGLPILK
jgi:putative hydrolase of the HAD superfamily